MTGILKETEEKEVEGNRNVKERRRGHAKRGKQMKEKRKGGSRVRTYR